MKEKTINNKSNINPVGLATLGDSIFEGMTQNKKIQRHTITGGQSRPPLQNPKSEHQLLTSNTRGITLIALVITIILMLILVGVTIRVSLNGELFGSAKEAKEETLIEMYRDELERIEIEVEMVNNNLSDEEYLNLFERKIKERELFKESTVTKEKEKLRVETKEGYEFDITVEGVKYIEKNGQVETDPPEEENYKPVLDLYDPEQEQVDAEEQTKNNLHIGDFVKYDAGTWKQEEIDAIQVGINNSVVSANKKKDLPTVNFQFGGFTVGDSRNENATLSNKDYNYIKDKDGNPINGWRVFDVNEDSGEVKLISAGCVEDYFSPSGYTYGLGSTLNEYVLTGNLENNPGYADLSNTCIKRNWDVYKNGGKYATKAEPIRKTMLDNWYEKYMGIEDADTSINDTFKEINGTRYDTLINNYSAYWLCNAGGENGTYELSPTSRNIVINGYACSGIRIVISLSTNVELKKTGEKTLNAGYANEGSYTYNIWELK